MENITNFKNDTILPIENIGGIQFLLKHADIYMPYLVMSLIGCVFGSMGFIYKIYLNKIN